MKRKLALFLSAAMATSCLPMTAYAANFKDINDVPWAGAAAVINSVTDKGLLSGYEDGTFRSRNNVTYCEAMQMVYNALVKTGAEKPIDAVDAYSYMGVLNTYKVPGWAQVAVAYGLHNGIIDMQMVATKFAGGNQQATREDVAIMFGNAMGKLFGKERDTSEAQGFADYWSISANALEQVSMLKKMGILNGDEYNRFNPKQNINRAEMAVMLNQTYSVVSDGVSGSGEIVELVKNGDNYYIAIKDENGRKEGFNISEGDIPVYVGNTTETMSMSRLSKGDDVVFMFNGSKLVALRVMKSITNQEKYDITGYINSIKDNQLSLENENTGEIDKYSLDSGTVCYVEGKKVVRKDLEDILKEHSAEYAFAGLITRVERERNKETDEFESVTYVDELYITFSQEYTTMGEVKSFGSSSVTVKLTDGSAEKIISFAGGCTFYIADQKVSQSEAEKLADSGTIYARLTINDQDKATKVELSEDTFAGAAAEKESQTYKVKNFSEKKMVLESGGKETTYVFGSTNPLDNIKFYTWDAPTSDWDSVSVSAAESYADADTYEDEDGNTKTVNNIYCKVTLNKGGKLSEVYLSAVKNAWKNSKDHQTERKGTVASLVDDVLKFKTSTVAYKMQKKYGSDDLNLLSVNTNSKTMLAKLANDDGIELYAEIKANGDNEVMKAEARVTKAVGKLMVFEPEPESNDNDGRKYIQIKTADGNEFKLQTQRSPKLTDKKEDEFELEDLVGANSKYIGETIELSFNSSGIVNRITMVDGIKENNAASKVKGIATAAADGLKVEGKTYRWLSKTSDIGTTNYSGPGKSLDTIKTMIDDPDVKVYVEATLDDKDRVEGIKVYVKEAEGELTTCDNDYVRIQTDSGNKFSFSLPSKLESCDVKGLNQSKLEDGDADNKGYDVKLTFGTDGLVSSIKDA